MGRALGIRAADVVLTASIVLIALAWWMYGIYGSRVDGSIAEVYCGSELIVTVPLSEERTIPIAGPLGKSIVEVRSGKVIMKSSPCRDKVCVHMGRIGKAGESILCIPNRVLVVIRSGSAGVDAVTY